MGIVKLDAAAKTTRPARARIPSGTELFTQVGETPCTFRTAYDVTLLPFEVDAVSIVDVGDLTVALGAANLPRQALRVSIRATAACAAESLAVVRFWLSGPTAAILYETLLNHVRAVVVTAAGAHVHAATVIPVGFADRDALLPTGGRIFPGFRLIQEYLFLPEKFLFVDIETPGWSRPISSGDVISYDFLLDTARIPFRESLLQSDTQSFQLGCTPAVNLFAQSAEPIVATHEMFEYPIIPDVRRRETEIYSVDSVLGVRPGSEPVQYSPLYGAQRHGDRFWIARRAPLLQDRNDAGEAVYLSLVDPSLDPTSIPDEVLSVRVTCSNGTLPAAIQPGTDRDLIAEDGDVVARFVSRPTRTVRPRLGRELEWFFISQLAIDHESLTRDGVTVLRRLLDIHNFDRAPHISWQLDGIRRLAGRGSVTTLSTPNGPAALVGTDMELELDELHFPDGQAFLFASVVEILLGLLSPINTYSQLTASSPQRKEPIRRWPPRAGHKPLI
jgi:type VI secretion system protein ImpG